jgi:hypothetical protein
MEVAPKGGDPACNSRSHRRLRPPPVCHFDVLIILKTRKFPEGEEEDGLRTAH